MKVTQSSGLTHVLWTIGTNVSKKSSASIFMVEGDVCSMFLRNIGVVACRPVAG
jgi:hypothetical protein